MHDLPRRNLLKLLALSAARALDGRAFALYNLAAPGSSSAAWFANEYTAYLPEKAALAAVPKVLSFDATAAKDGKRSAARVGEDTGGWRLLVIARLKGNKTAVFEKHATHRGAMAYVTVESTPQFAATVRSGRLR